MNLNRSFSAVDWGALPDWIVGMAVLVVSFAALRISQNHFRISLAPRLESFFLRVCRIQEGTAFPIPTPCLHWEVLLSNPGAAMILIQDVETHLDGRPLAKSELWIGRSHPLIIRAQRWLGIFPWELSHAEPTVVRAETLARPIDGLAGGKHTLTMFVTYRSGGRRRRIKVSEAFSASDLDTLDRSVEELEYDSSRRVFDRERPPLGGHAPQSKGEVESRNPRGGGYIHDLDSNEQLWADPWEFQRAQSAQAGDVVTYRIVHGEPNRRAVGIEFAEPSDEQPVDEEQ